MNNNQTTIRTRFAPSPTGYLHVGGARTALFCWLFARKHQGRFILRIEDTDKARNTAESLVGILNDLEWLGLDYDEGPDADAVRQGELKSRGDFGPYFQSQRDDIYAHYYQKLLESGRAYYAWETPQELEIARKTATKLKQTYRYQRPQALVTDEAEAKRQAGGKPVVIRFKSPETPIVVPDLVLGETTFPPDHVDDFVIRKADGGATFHFANVVDDALMQITHVIRAQEHLNNTPRHLALQDALGLAHPAYAHIPLVFNAVGTKMSKRDKDKAVKEAANVWLKTPGHDLPALVAAASALRCEKRPVAEVQLIVEEWLKDKKGVLQDGDLRTAIAQASGLAKNKIPEIDVHDFRVSGYLPHVILNYTALLGWSAGDDREKYTLPELTAAFDLTRIGKTNARFDRDKLLTFNTQENNRLFNDSTGEGKKALRQALRDYLAVNPQSPIAQTHPSDEKLDELIGMNEGFRIFRDIDEKSSVLFLADEAYPFDPKAIQKVLEADDGAGWKLLADVQAVLQSVGHWSAEELEKIVAGFVAQRGLNLGQVAQPLRVALCGSAISPPIWGTLQLLGKDCTLARIARCLQLKNERHA